MDLLQQHNTRRKHYYGYGSVIDKRVFSSELASWVLEREAIGRTRCVRSVIWGLY
jgi:hypothetical protein